MEGKDVRLFIELSRTYIERILAFNKVMPKNDVSLFDSMHWRTFWYDPVSGLTALSAWDPTDLVNKNYLLPNSSETEKLVETQRYAVYQLPPAFMLPTFPTGKYPMKRMPDMCMEQYNAKCPIRMPLAEISVWTSKWCDHRAKSINQKHCL